MEVQTNSSFKKKKKSLGEDLKKMYEVKRRSLFILAISVSH